MFAKLPSAHADWPLLLSGLSGGGREEGEEGAPEEGPEGGQEEEEDEVSVALALSSDIVVGGLIEAIRSNRPVPAATPRPRPAITGGGVGLVLQRKGRGVRLTPSCRWLEEVVRIW